MNIQLDTNFLARLGQPVHPHHQSALACKAILESAGHALCIVPQNLYEFWAVATRPIGEFGLGLSVPEAKSELEIIKRSFNLHHDSPSLFEEWENLVVTFECKGKTSHDARIVAAMKLNGLDQLLTFNGKDFRRYSFVTILDPLEVALKGA